MIHLLLAALTALNFGSPVSECSDAVDFTHNEISVEEIADNTTFVQWTNYSAPLNADPASLDLFEKYGINAEEAQRSLGVYVRQENVPCEYDCFVDEKGEWINWIETLENKLSTERTKQDYFAKRFVKGIFGLKFVAHKETPNTNRNKGRISIGQMKFTTLEIGEQIPFIVSIELSETIKFRLGNETSEQ